MLSVLVLTLTIKAYNEGYPKVPGDFRITEKAATRAFSWLKAPTSAFTFKTTHGVNGHLSVS